jgi:anti-sigma factor RsiW
MTDDRHPTDLELADWIDGKLIGDEHGAVARHVMACHTCAGLVVAQGDAAYQLLRTSWRSLADQPFQAHPEVFRW